LFDSDDADAEGDAACEDDEEAEGGEDAPPVPPLSPQPVSSSNPANTAVPMLFQPLNPAFILLSLSGLVSLARIYEKGPQQPKTPPDSGGRS
jgi:hypothetical protein